MADGDNLDTLSNAELRQKMLEQGLPNIPVTDSSRKVLVKRLRASIGGNASAAASAATASPKTKSNRRETLAPTAVSQSQPAASSREPKARRTIAFSAVAEREMKEANDRRRQQQSQPVEKTAAATQSRLPEKVVKKPVEAPVAAPAPIQTRRSSQSARQERPEPTTRILRNAEPIEEEPASAQPDFPVNSTIVLDSDEDEDRELIEATQKAEERERQKQRQKLTSTTVSTHEYVSRSSSLYPSLGSKLPVLERRQIGGERIEPSQPLINLVPTPALNRHPFITTAEDIQAERNSGRYSSYASTSSATTTNYNVRRSPAAHLIANEFSDDPESEDNAEGGGHFESSFARNLARLRAERIGDRSSPYNRRTIATSSLLGSGLATNYDQPTARRSLRPEEGKVSAAFQRWCLSLDRKYNLKLKLFIVAVVLALIAAYVIFN